MKKPIRLQLNLTRQYNLGWESEEQHLDVCEGRATAPRRIPLESDEDWMEGFIVELSPQELARAKAAWKDFQARIRRDLKEERSWRELSSIQPATFRRFIEWSLGDVCSFGCRCEHDCCGHVQGSAVANQLSPRHYSVRVRKYHNV